MRTLSLEGMAEPGTASHASSFVGILAFPRPASIRTFLEPLPALCQLGSAIG